MKRFYFTERPDPRSRKGDRIIRVYTLHNGMLQYVTETSHRPGCGSSGARSEAFQALMECGAIPRKWEKSSEGPRSGPGYFCGPVTDLYDIQEIY